MSATARLGREFPERRADRVDVVRTLPVCGACLIRGGFTEDVCGAELVHCLLFQLGSCGAVCRFTHCVTADVLSW